jgi:phosphoribosyl-ATP pyrophosphohydrolase|tara:strand:- start:91 stop:387 length:297 start_codon:yes stop_codon:yes gene_type:complete
MIDELVKTIRVNKKKNIKTSYTSFLINSGLGNCVSKMQEEFDELVEAINKDKNQVHEAADLIYHFLVTLEAANIKFEDVVNELEKRTKQSGLSEKNSR